MRVVFKFIVAVLGLFVMVHANLRASELGVRITTGPWATQYSGFIRDSTQEIDTLYLDQDLNLENNLQSFFYVYLEQPYAVIPNFRIGQTNLTTIGNNNLSKTLTFGDTVYTGNQQIRSKLNLDHIEATVYWSILRDDIGFDIGLNIKDFGGEVLLEGETAGLESNSINGTIPMFYIAFDAPLMQSDYIIGIDASYLNFESASIFDSLFFIRSATKYYVGFELGYRLFQINYSKQPFRSEVKIDGLYVNGYVYF